jgi:hypothetical protein
VHAFRHGRNEPKLDANLYQESEHDNQCHWRKQKEEQTAGELSWDTLAVAQESHIAGDVADVFIVLLRRHGCLPFACEVSILPGR